MSNQSSPQYFQPQELIMSDSNKSIKEDFLTYLSQNKAENTQITYASALNIIAHLDWTNCSQKDLINWRNEYIKSISPNTAQNRIVLIKSFFKYLVKSNIRQDDPSILLQLPQKESGNHNEYELVSKDIYKEILEDIGIPLTDRLAIALGIGCGLRISEICNLKIEHIDLYENMLTVYQSKRNKTRVLPVPDWCMYLIHRQIERLYEEGESGYLLRNRFGEQFTTDRLRQRFNKVKEKYNLGDEITFHTNRHFFASEIVNNPSVSIPVASEALGHSSWKTTEVYRHKDKEQLKSQVLSAINNIF